MLELIISVSMPDRTHGISMIVLFAISDAGDTIIRLLNLAHGEL
jgi:hypothetical protein